MNQDIAVQTLLSIGVDPDRFDDSARQEFLERCKSGPTRDVLAFLTCGMPASGPQFQTPPIARAAEGGGLERILLLHSHGADLDERDASGDTALHTAANWNRGRLVVQLMQAGASADVVNNKRWTPLTYALAEENSDVVDVLLAHGADPNFSPVDGGPLVFALDKPYLLERMLEAGANASAAYKDGNTLLLVATSRDHAETVRLLLDAGAEDPPNPHGWTARMVADALGLTTIIREMDQRGVPSSDTSFYTLHVAAKAGKLDRLKELVEAGQPLDARDWLGKTPLLAAAQGNQHNAVRFLVERGADAKASAEGANAVTYAARDGELELLNILLEAGAPANETEGNSLALILAATTSSDVVERLLKAGAAVDSTDSYDQTALYCAAAANRLDIAQLLLAAGASSTSGDSTGGHLPLQIATLEGHVEMVRLLVESGADLDTREPVLGNTALLTACGGYENTDPAFAEIVRILLDAGADYTVTPKFGQSTPRLEAESTKNQPCLDAMMAFLTDPAREPDPEVIAALLAAGELDRVRAIIEDGLDPTVLTAGPQPPIFAALSLADPTLANLMLDHGADPHARFLGQTTLDVAAGRGDIALVDRLLAMGIDPNATREDSNLNAMTAAADGGHVPVMKRLVEAGAKVDPWRAGWTPLMCAAESGHVEAVEWLLGEGANPTVRNSFGETPREAAREQRVVQILTEFTSVDTIDGHDQTPAATELGGRELVDVRLEGGSPLEPQVGDTVRIPDAGLRAALSYTEGLEFDGDAIRQSEISSITYLDWTEDGIGEHDPRAFVRISDLDGLEWATALTEVGLTGNRLQSLEPLATCQNLTDIWAGSNEIVDISAVSNMPLLRRLNLADNRTLTDIAAVGGARSLRLLDLSRTAVEDLTPLQDLDQLEEVRLWGLQFQEESPNWDVLAGLRARGVEVLGEPELLARL